VATKCRWPYGPEWKRPVTSPAILSYSAIKIHIAKSSLVRFGNKNIFFYIEKCSSLLQRCSALAL
jgi:hypothetical protein